MYSGLVVDLGRDSDAGNIYTALDNLADPGEARGCSIKIVVIILLIQSVSLSYFVKNILTAPYRPNG